MGASVFHFYTRLFSDLGAALTTYVNDTATNVIAAITPVATTLVTIYVMLWGWSMMRGVISEPITDGVSRIVRLALITALALNIGYYNGFLSDWLWNAPDALASVVTGGSGATNAAFLDTLMGQMYDLGLAFHYAAHAHSSLGIPSIPLVVMAYAVWTAGILATAYGAFLLALAKMGLAIALGVGPLFILLTIFEPTKRFFDAWLGQTLNYVFMVVLAAAGIKVILTILQTYLTTASGALTDPGLDQAIPAIVFALIGVLVFMQLPAMASALGGGVAISTLGAVAWAYGRTKGGVAAMRPTTMKRSLLKTGRDFRIAGGVANKAMGGAPMAVYRKITGASKNRVAKA